MHHNNNTATPCEMYRECGFISDRLYTKALAPEISRGVKQTDLDLNSTKGHFFRGKTGLVKRVLCVCLTWPRAAWCV
jgi:hypothetical protein